VRTNRARAQIENIRYLFNPEKLLEKSLRIKKYVPPTPSTQLLENDFKI
jgi:hypothetical protein